MSAEIERATVPLQAGNRGDDGAGRQSSGDGGLAQRVGKLSRAYLGTRAMVAHLRREGTDARLTERIEGCGHYLRFRHFYLVERWKLLQASFCEVHQVCHLCAFNRAARYGANLSKMAGAAMEADPRLKAVALTLSVRNGPDCVERLQRLAKGLSKLMESRRKGRSGSGRHKSSLASCEAGFLALECTRNHLSGEWHWHVHALLLVVDWIDQDDLRAEWGRCVGEPVSIPYLQRVKDGGLMAAVCEVVKYSVKFSAIVPEHRQPGRGELRPSDVLTIYRAGKGSRLIRTFGLFRGDQLDLPEDDCADLDGQPFRDLLYRAMGSAGYTLVEVSEEHHPGGKHSDASRDRARTLARQ